MTVSQWYTMLDEAQRHAILQGRMECLAYGTYKSYHLLPDYAQKLVAAAFVAQAGGVA